MSLHTLWHSSSIRYDRQALATDKTSNNPAKKSIDFFKERMPVKPWLVKYLRLAPIESTVSADRESNKKVL